MYTKVFRSNILCNSCPNSIQSHNGNIDGSTRIPGFDVGRGADPSGNGSNDQGPPLKKRKPILTLKIDRIFSDKGLPYIQKEFPKLKFKGKGHEVFNLFSVASFSILTPRYLHPTL